MRVHPTQLALIPLLLMAFATKSHAEENRPPSDLAVADRDTRPGELAPAVSPNSGGERWNQFRPPSAGPTDQLSNGDGVETTRHDPVTPGPGPITSLAKRRASGAEPGLHVGAAGEMIGFSASDGSGTQTITLVHTAKSWMAVYHIDRSGTIRLVSSRPIDADFALQLNPTAPLPEEIRQLGASR
jgi:hypothetical protein